MDRKERSRSASDLDSITRSGLDRNECSFDTSGESQLSNAAGLVKFRGGAVDVTPMVAIEASAVIIEGAHLREVRGVVPRKPYVEPSNPIGRSAHVQTNLGAEDNGVADVVVVALDEDGGGLRRPRLRGVQGHVRQRKLGADC